MRLTVCLPGRNIKLFVFLLFSAETTTTERRLALYRHRESCFIAPFFESSHIIPLDLLQAFYNPRLLIDREFQSEELYDDYLVDWAKAQRWLKKVRGIRCCIEAGDLAQDPLPSADLAIGIHPEEWWASGSVGLKLVLFRFWENTKRSGQCRKQVSSGSQGPDFQGPVVTSVGARNLNVAQFRCEVTKGGPWFRSTAAASWLIASSK